MTLIMSDYEKALVDIAPWLLEQIDISKKGEIFVKLKDIQKEMSNTEREFLDKSDMTIYMTIGPLLLKKGIHIELTMKEYLYIRRLTEEEIKYIGD